MPSRRTTRERAIELFQGADYPEGLDHSTAWLGIYQVLLWLVPTQHHGTLPHIIEADKFRSESSPWVSRSLCIRSHLCELLKCDEQTLRAKVDLLMQCPGYVGLQRQNPLGIASGELIAHVMSKFGDQALVIRTEVPATELFPGVQLQSRSRNPRVDIVAFRSGRPVAIISTKWSVRHDRLVDIIDEAISYKTAAVRTGREIPCFFVTNEFDPARLDKLIGAQVVDAVIHVHPDLFTKICGLNDRLLLMKNLGYLCATSHCW